MNVGEMQMPTTLSGNDNMEEARRNLGGSSKTMMFLIAIVIAAVAVGFSVLSQKGAASPTDPPPSTSLPDPVTPKPTPPTGTTPEVKPEPKPITKPEITPLPPEPKPEVKPTKPDSSSKKPHSSSSHSSSHSTKPKTSGDNPDRQLPRLPSPPPTPEGE